MARRAVLTAMALALATTPVAHADEGHQITATCTANHANVIPPSRYNAHAQAGGHLRPISTSVECTVTQGSLPRGTFGATLPGPYVVAHHATSDTWAGETPTVCVRAWAYWSDGHTLETSGCANVKVTAEAVS